MMKRVLLLALFVAMVGIWGLWYLGGSGEKSRVVSTNPLLEAGPAQETSSAVTWAPKDADQDGRFDWEEELLTPSEKETLTAEDKNAVTSVRFALTRKQAPLIPAETVAIIPETIYSLADLQLVNSDNPLVSSTYVKNLRDLMSVFYEPGIGYEISLANQAVETAESGLATQIASLSARYQGAVEKLLELEVPAGAAQLHLNLVNALSRLGQGAAIMSQVGEEPLAALGAAELQSTKLKYLVAAVNNINIYFFAQGLAYQNEARPILSIEI